MKDKTKEQLLHEVKKLRRELSKLEPPKPGTGRSGETPQSEDAYNRCLIEACLDSFVTINKEGKITDVNASTEAITGYPRKELIGTDFCEYFTESEEAKTGCQKVFREGSIRDYELKLKHRDGHVTPVLYNASVYRDGTGEVAGVLATARDITERKRFEEKIKNSLAEKETLLQEIHHRVKNNLQIISSLLAMAGRRADIPQARELCRDTRGKIHAMSLVHSLIYQSERLDSVNTAKYVKKLYQHLSNIYEPSDKNKITPVFLLEDAYLSVNQAIPFSLILNEVLTNVFKHAFPGKKSGKVEISLKKNDSNIIFLRISDNGTGISEKTDVKNTNTLGFKMIRDLVKEQLAGMLHIESRSGTTLSIQFGMEKPKTEYQ
ncbi:MAG: histidine kinase dimerization/phosphoacceptor domain -containing protein [Thermodesulfobacteriota bacterium]|nr:histidine kinase dimerization/phosphoacceptor domain -containing protein [Thermodesulfobacteriota bacterium]